MSNPWEKYGIDHLSPSQISSFEMCPAHYVLERLMKVRGGTVGVPALAGTAIEKGVAQGLMFPTATVGECIGTALKEYRALTALSADPKKNEYLDAVPAFVTLALVELRPYGVPTSTQGKVSYQPEGLHIPIIGFYDFKWDQHGLIVDLKTTMRMPSSVKDQHARQVSLYTANTNFNGRLTYVTPKKVSTYANDNAVEHLNGLTKRAMTMQRFLQAHEDTASMCAHLIPRYDHFKWNDATQRAAALKVWGY